MDGLLDTLRRYWDTLLAELDAVRGTPFIIALLALCALLMSTPQGADLAVTAGSDTCKAAWMVLATAFYGFQCWLWTRFIIHEHSDPPAEDDKPKQDRKRRARLARTSIAPKLLPLIHWLQAWTPRILGGAPFAIAALATFRANVDLAPLPWIFLALGAVAVFLFWARRGAGELLNLKGEQPILRALRWGSIVLGVVAMAVVCLWPVGPAQFLGAISVVFVGLGFLTALLACLLQAGRFSRLPVIAALVVLAAIFSQSNDNHQVGRRTFNRAAPFHHPVGGGKVTLEDALFAWCDRQVGKCSDKTPIVFVAAEGGASRAGYWAADVLGRLQADTDMAPAGKPAGAPFSNRVFAISSVSGGTVGALAYISALKEQADLTAKGLAGPTATQFADGMTSVSAVDYLSPAMAGLLFPDLLQRLIPFPVLPDRAETLEVGFEAGWTQHCRDYAKGSLTLKPDSDPNHVACADRQLWSKPFLSLFPPIAKAPDLPDPKARLAKTKAKAKPEPAPEAGAPQGPWLPVLLINGARQEDGRRIITSNIQIAMKDFPNAIDYHALTGQDVRVSTAISNGARFPLVSPSGTLIDRQGQPQGHVIDGGYFDGGGIASMADVAQAVLKIGEKRGYRLQPVFVEINNDSDTDDSSADLIRARAACGCKASDAVLQPSPTHSFLNELMGPLEGLYSARSAHGTAAGMALSQAVADAGGTAPGQEIATADQAGLAASAAVADAAPPIDPAGQGSLGHPWGESPFYYLVHLCRTSSVSMPMDWALSKSAMRHADEALGIPPRAQEPGLQASDGFPQENLCGGPATLKNILAASGATYRRSISHALPADPDDGPLWGWLAVAVAAIVAAGGAIFAIDWSLRRPKSPGTGSLQASPAAADITAAIAVWRRAGRIWPRGRKSTLTRWVWGALAADLVLICGYVGTVVILAILLGHHQPYDVQQPEIPVIPYLQPLFHLGAGLAIAAGIADLIEDLLLAWMIRQGPTRELGWLCTWVTRAKWLLLVLSLLVLSIAAIMGCHMGG